MIKKNDYVLFILEKDKIEIEREIVKRNFTITIANIHWHSLSEQVFFPPLLYNAKLDIMHFPYFSVPIGYNKPFVLTIHDLIIHHFPTGKASTLPLPIYSIKRLAYKTILQKASQKAKKNYCSAYCNKRGYRKNIKNIK